MSDTVGEQVDLEGDLPGLTFRRMGPIAILTLNRPEAGNSLTRAMRPVVRQVWAEVRSNPSIHALIITGAGDRHFCTGIDLVDARESGSTASGNGRARTEMVWSPLHFEVWKPVICALNGLVAGGGLHFVADSDIVVASENASIMDTHTTVGMVGAVENTALAVRLPIGSVMRMTMQGKSYRMTAERAYQLGLVDELVPKGQSLDTAIQIAQEIIKNSPAAISLSKQAIWSLHLGALEAAQEYGWSLARLHWQHPDFVEGPMAFREKREPQWKNH